MSKVHSSSQNLSRIDGIDILRGLSIFLVLMNHVHMRLFLSKIPYTEGMPAQLVSSLVWGGQRGVQIFFCISGFLIASTSIKRWGSLAQMKARSFYWLRLTRIAPLFLVLLAVLSGLHHAGFKDFVVSDKVGGLGQALLSALTFRINVHEATLGYLPGNWDVLWSLSVEEMFYLFFPVVCILLARFRAIFVVLALFIVLGPFSRTVFSEGNEVWSEYSYLGCMDAISLGVLTALLSVQFRLSPVARVWLFRIGTVILVFSLGFSRTAREWGLNRLGLDMTVLAIGTCLIMVSAAQSQWRASCLLYPVLKLGERSYEIYLTHMIVILIFFQWFLSFGKPMVGIPVLFLLSILASVLLGEVVARFYSEPMNAWLRRGLGKKDLGTEQVALR